MRRILFIVLCGIFTVGLTSCSTFVSERMLHLKKGSTPSEVMNADGDVVDKEIISIKGDGLDSKSVYTLVISELSAATNDNYWLYGFKDNKLFYWGYPYQFQRSSDDEVRVFGELATKVLVDKKYVKATKQ